MKIDERQEGDLTILDLKGKLVMGDGDGLLREKVSGLIAEGRTAIALNLVDVPYIDSGGLGEIVLCYTAVSRKNGKLRLLNINKRIHDLLSATKLLSFFDDDDDRPSGASGVTSLGAAIEVKAQK
jgi:anti-sigma B factor antagonist